MTTVTQTEEPENEWESEPDTDQPMNVPRENSHELLMYRYSLAHGFRLGGEAQAIQLRQLRPFSSGSSGHSTATAV